VIRCVRLGRVCDDPCVAMDHGPLSPSLTRTHPPSLTVPGSVSGSACGCSLCVVQRETLQSALSDASDGRRRAEERLKTLATDARKQFESRESALVDDRKALKAQLDELLQRVKTDKAARKVRHDTLLLCGGGGHTCTGTQAVAGTHRHGHTCTLAHRHRRSDTHAQTPLLTDGHTHACARALPPVNVHPYWTHPAVSLHTHSHSHSHSLRPTPAVTIRCPWCCVWHQAEAEELLRLREKVRTMTASSSQSAREAKLMEARALQLAAEVDRVKDMLQVRHLRPSHCLRGRVCVLCALAVARNSLRTRD
jgi:hypothetical protein